MPCVPGNPKDAFLPDVSTCARLRLEGCRWAAGCPDLLGWQLPCTQQLRTCTGSSCSVTPRRHGLAACHGERGLTGPADTDVAISGLGMDAHRSVIAF
jgi:hypothetical protein